MNSGWSQEITWWLQEATGWLHEVTWWFWKPEFKTIEYAPGLICNINWKYGQTRDLKKFYSNKIPSCRCEWYCLKESTTRIGISWIIIIIWLICRYIKKHKKK